eukprot:TRINITY_DN3230_c0_g2_i2.p1 TRINITY_DN3230_c0_g2~~TRINITY_DN3230_c0_g2_i2.p1  ORF type:complete len:1156 (+),score=437.92 TRINITY_DN3230_c0_g2_i2:88-3468(+)
MSSPEVSRTSSRASGVRLGIFTGGSAARFGPATPGRGGQPDDWMVEMREKEKARRRELEHTRGQDRPPGAGDGAVRITSDEEETKMQAMRTSVISTPHRRSSSIHDIVASQVAADVRKRLSGELQQKPPPKSDDQGPVNMGKEPPTQPISPRDPVGGYRGAVSDSAMEGKVLTPRSGGSSPRSPRKKLPTAQSTGARIDIVHGRGADAGDSGSEQARADTYEAKVGRFASRFRVSIIVLAILAIAVTSATVANLADHKGILGYLPLVLAAAQTMFVAAAVHFCRAEDAELGKDTELLHSILPSDVVAQMHDGVRCIAVRHDSLTFCFSDLVGFTKATSGADAALLVSGLNKLFSTFDHLAQSMGIMKVKTMGDAYMAVAGFGDPDDHPHKMVLWALAVLSDLAELTLDELNVDRINVRMGVATGPAISGCIGVTKPVYDFWGDTVNMASRMESNGVTNRINCTSQVRDYLRERHGYSFEPIHDVFVKGKGRMDTYLLINERGIHDDDSEAGMQHNQVQDVEQAAAAPSALSTSPASPQQAMGEIEQLASMQSEREFHKDIKQVLTCVSALTEELELQKATQLVVQTVRDLLGCDRATLFMVDSENRELWSFHNLDDKGRRIRMPIDKGIAGWAATRGETVNIHDAYEDSRFNKQIDIMTGYRTRTLLCYPVKRADRVIAVIQAVNKESGVFNDEDLLLLSLLGRQAGIHLMHGTVYEQLRQSETRAYILFEVSRDLSTKLNPADVFQSVMNGARQFMRCDRATLYILDYGKRELYSLKGHAATSPKMIDSIGKDLEVVEQITIPIGKGIPGHVAVVGESLNVVDAYEVPLFDPSFDQKTGYKTRSVLCVPIVDPSQQSSFEGGLCLGVLEVINKFREGEQTQEPTSGTQYIPFSQTDEEYLMSFASFVAVTIRNVMLYQQNLRHKERGSLLLRISMVSATAASHRDLAMLLQREIPSSLGCACCTVFVLESQSVLHTWTNEGQLQEIALASGSLASSKGITGSVLAGEIPHYNSVTSEGGMGPDPRYNPAIDNVTGVPQIHSCLIAPLADGGRIVGAVQLINKLGDPTLSMRAQETPADSVFESYDEDFLREICAVAAVHVTSQFHQGKQKAGGEKPGSQPAPAAL